MAFLAALFLISCLSFHFGWTDLVAHSLDACLLGFLVPFLHLIVGLPYLGGNINPSGFYLRSVFTDLC